MKKVPDRDADEVRPEYDFAAMTGGVRGKYAQRFREGTNLVRLDPDVAAIFPNETIVNDTLRKLIQLAEAQTHLTR